MTKLRFMSVRFSTPVTMAELPKFRGAVIAAAGASNDLFHNHIDNGFAYRYPLVQYRIMSGNAGIVCLNEGIEQMQQLLSGNFLLSPICFGKRMEPVIVEDLRVNEFELCFLEESVCYRISRWMPFNQSNYRQWNALSTDEERTSMLEKVMIGNIISFAKGIGWQLDQQIKVKIDTSTIIERHTTHKGQHLVAISVDFACNIFLPRGIALGKGVSLNKGIISIPRKTKL